jgi:hypothetical protein
MEGGIGLISSISPDSGEGGKFFTRTVNSQVCNKSVAYGIHHLSGVFRQAGPLRTTNMQGSLTRWAHAIDTSTGTESLQVFTNPESGCA